MTPTNLMMVVVILLILCAHWPVESGCGKRVIAESRQSKIVGGHDTYEGEFPWVVSVRKHSYHHCGGVLVGQRWVLTAAHCVQNQNHTNFVVRVGEHDLAKHERMTRDYELSQIFIHPNYSRIRAYDKHMFVINNADIALLKTRDDIHMSEYAWPICLPAVASANQSSLIDREAVVIGWGKKSEKSDVYSEKLQKVQVNIISEGQCAHWFKLTGRRFQITDRILCAGHQDGGKDACHGDSGGPLLVKHRNPNNGAEFYYVAGIVSTGIGCARPLLPGIYSNVSSYLRWIDR